MLKRLWEKLFRDRDMEVRERLFRIIILVGTAAAALGILEGLVMDGTGIVLVPLCGLFIAMGGALIATFKYNRIELAAVVMGIVIVGIIFPSVFFISGGVESGSMVWFVIGIFYVFLMFSGKKLGFFLTLTIIIDVTVYVFGYHHPEFIKPLATKFDIYFDSLFSVLLVGTAAGAILKFQNKVYEKERELAAEQTARLKQVSHSRDVFFANMSHEIRTPINTIIGLNEMILREEISDEVADNARNIQNASRMLLSLVNDILDLSQIENQKMEIIPVEYDTKEFFTEVVDLMQVRMQEKKLDFFVDLDGKIPSVLYGDEKRLKQILINLLTNAVKYTKEGSVTLAARAEQIRKDAINLRISVADTGVGIRKENLEGLYDSFKRVDTENNSKIEGSGLGLSIVKQLLDMMGGEITVDSIYTKGSEFTVILEQKVSDAAPIGNVDFQERAGRAARSKYQKSFEAPEARILVVDDDDMNLLVATKLLRATKVQIDTAKSGGECLEQTRKKFYHVILLDHMMLGMNGIDTLKEIRKQENGLCRDTPVIALTATAAPGSEKRYLEYGFDGYLAKPVDAKLLEAEILRFLPEDILEYRISSEEQEERTSEVQKVLSRKRKKIYITADCVCDIPGDLLEKYDIRQMYLYIETDKGTFRDTREIASNNLSQYLTASTSNVKAVAATVEEYETFFAERLTEAEDVIHISLAEHTGRSYGNAVAASRGFGHVHVIDSGHVSCGQALVVLHAASMAKEGCGVSEICAEIERLKDRIETSFMLPSAQIFYQNGYTDRITAKVCECFRLHPVLRIRQSRLVICGMRFGKLENGWKHFIRHRLLRKRRIDPRVVYITHVACNVRQQEMIVKEIKKCIPFEHVIIQRSSVSNAVNSGIGTIGIAFVTKRKE